MFVPVAPGRWPFLGHTPVMLRGRLEFTSSLRRYGDLVKIYLGPMQTYFVTSPELAHRVLVADGHSFEKGAIVDKFRPFMGNGLIMSNGTFHRRQRRLVQPAFHHDRIARYTDTMVRTASELIESWRPGEIRQVDKDMKALGVDIAGETLFSAELGRAAIAEARRSIPVVLKEGMIRALSPAIFERLPIPANRRFDKAVERLRRIVLEVITRWRADSTDHGDLLSMLLLTRDEDTGEGMSDQQIYDEVITLLTAGSETSAHALIWMFHELGHHPEVERRLHAEVDEVLGGRSATFSDIPKLEYTRRVANEVLRMYPVWILMRRANAPVDLGGARLPAGSEVMISPHALHFDPTVHVRPQHFDPDRWLPDRTAALPKGAFIPFGAGTRQCIGNYFAQTEIIVVTATIAAKWRLVPVPGKPVRVKTTTMAYPNQLPMAAVPRT